MSRKWGWRSFFRVENEFLHHLLSGVYSLDQVKGDVRRRNPFGLIKPGATFEAKKVGLGKRSIKLAANTRSKVPRFLGR